MPRYNKKITKYYFLVSGGKDSTAMVLKAHDEGIKGELIYGNTRLNLKGAKRSLDKLVTYVDWPLHEVKYTGDKKPITVLKESFLKVPQAIEHMKNTGNFRRNMFQCCNILKHKPMIEFCKALSEDSCFVLGIKGLDHSIHRIYRMKQLRELDTFYRRHKNNGLLYYYPLRDWNDTQVEDKLREHGFQDVKSSGCSICPLFCVFEKWGKKDPDTWRRSVQMADRLGIKHPAQGQQFLTEYQCKELK